MIPFDRAGSQPLPVAAVGTTSTTPAEQVEQPGSSDSPRSTLR